MPEGVFDVNFVYHTTPAQCSDPLCDMVNSGELKPRISFALPAFTDLPWGTLRSIITLLLVEFDFFLVMKGKVCKSPKAGASKGPKIVLYFISSCK